MPLFVHSIIYGAISTAVFIQYRML